MSNVMTDEQIRKQWGYDGKPKQWQQGFDCALRELTEARKGMFTEEEVKDFGMFMCEPNWKGIDTDFEQWLTERKGR